MRNFMNKIRQFASNESGAVTVDWVALTAAVVVIGIALVYAVFGTGSDGVAGLVDNLAGELGTAASNIEGAVASSLPTASTTTTTTGG